LLKVIEARRGHHRLPLEKTLAGVPLKRRRQPWLRLRPPERLFHLASYVAPRQSDVMQVTITPPCQFRPLAPALAPDMQRFTELGEKP
jgi:hypothetical protein